VTAVSRTISQRDHGREYHERGRGERRGPWTAVDKRQRGLPWSSISLEREGVSVRCRVDPQEAKGLPIGPAQGHLHSNTHTITHEKSITCLSYWEGPYGDQHKVLRPGVAYARLLRTLRGLRTLSYHQSVMQASVVHMGGRETESPGRKGHRVPWVDDSTLPSVSPRHTIMIPM
jgi:hypothetical protein